MSAKICDCEQKTELARIRCMIDTYKKFMELRRQPLSNKRLESLHATTRLKDISLSIDVNSVTHELAESQILFTFMQHYLKTHPNYFTDGPELGDIHLKNTFFAST